jgi:hypothetical protein
MLVVKAEWKKPLGRHRRRCDDNIKLCLKQVLNDAVVALQAVMAALLENCNGHLVYTKDEKFLEHIGDFSQKEIYSMKLYTAVTHINIKLYTLHGLENMKQEIR